MIDRRSLEGQRRGGVTHPTGVRVKMADMRLPRRFRTPLGLRFSLLAPLVCSVACGAVACGSTATPPTTPGSESQVSRKAKPASAERLLREGRERLEASDYAEAERLFRSAEAAGSGRAALPGLGRVFLHTGLYDEAAQLGLESTQTQTKAQGDHAQVETEIALVRAEGLRRLGRLDEAARALAGTESSLEASLLTGEIELERGNRDKANEALMRLIEAYNAEKIRPEDGRTIAAVGRAAHLLRSPHDANDAFDQAEQAAPGDVRTLLWRAELYLEKYDISHAEQVLSEALDKAPNHPEAKALLGQAALSHALAFDDAERLAKEALEVNPRLTDAYFVLAGIDLRDMEIASAEGHLAQGLRTNPRDLELLAMGATARFLADDEPGFEKAVEHVLELNPTYTQLFSIIGEYADWEHRYDDIVRLMRRATRIDPEDGHARAQLGLNLIRAGRDAAGVVELRRAFESDPFNLRVYNTLKLYEEVIPRDYETAQHGRFRIRYPKVEKPLLERYVPKLLDEAWAVMVKHYGFEPEGRVGIELYAQRDQFAVRTSGLPSTAIQGVCFGHTLAAMALSEEKSNLGMTLWHELAHVFHIRKSESHVPRWFTEGLAEVETALARTEWTRELDPSLYRALRGNRLPAVASMSRAFTRAEQMEDIGTAYYASTKIVEMLLQDGDMGKLSTMLELWGKGERTDSVLERTWGVGPDAVDSRFKAHLKSELGRYDAQFVPTVRRGNLGAIQARAKKAPEDADAQLMLALAAFDEGAPAEARALAGRLLEKDPDHADARYLVARIALSEGKPDQASKELHALAGKGHDGYAVRMLLGRIALSSEDFDSALSEFEKAAVFDPTQSDPLAAIAVIHRKRGNADAELRALDRLVVLEEQIADLHMRRLELLVDQKQWDRAVAAGEMAIWVDLSNIEIHRLYARALEGAGERKQALFELESAVLGDGRPAEVAQAHLALADAYQKRGMAQKARQEIQKAKALESSAPIVAPGPLMGPSL